MEKIGEPAGIINTLTELPLLVWLLLPSREQALGKGSWKGSEASASCGLGVTEDRGEALVGSGGGGSKSSLWSLEVGVGVEA